MKLALALLIAAPAFAADAPAPSADRAKTLYALGAKVAKDYMLKADDAKVVADGLADAAAGKALTADPKDLRLELMALQRNADDARRAAQLDAYAKEPGAKRLPSGLVIKELKAGTGAHPTATNVVKVHYHGTFPDGTVFDSSVQRGEPSEFPLNGVIPCWTEGVQLIGVGGKAKLVCPYSIAYGERGRPPVIPERATLVFEVELLSISK
jgi:FKBP-type peptidyl-prolyl cis-trans isomerase FkpA